MCGKPMAFRIAPSFSLRGYASLRARRSLSAHQFSRHSGELSRTLSNIGNPKSLIMNFNTFQTARRQFFLSQSEKGEVWQIAQNGLKPTVKRQNLSHSLVQKLVCVECQHGNVLRSSRRGN